MLVLYVVCCEMCGVLLLLDVICWSLFVVRCSLFFVCLLLGVLCLLYVVCWLLRVVRRCLLPVVRGLLFVVYCPLLAVCRLRCPLFAAC